MRCVPFRLQIDDSIDGDLTPEAEQALRAHLSECQECREEFARAEEIKRLLGERGRQEVPEELHGQLIRAAREEALRGKPHRKRTGLNIALIAAALVVCLAVPVGLGMSGILGSGLMEASPEEQKLMVSDYGAATDMAMPEPAAAAPMEGAPAPMATSAPQAVMGRSAGEAEMANEVTYDEAAGAVRGGEPAPTHGQKLIRSGSAQLQSRAFDADLEAIQTLVATMGGYVEYSDVSGVPYDIDPESYGRYASLNIRVPVAELDAMLQALEGIGNLTGSSQSAYDITTQYYDTEFRLASYTAQHERLTQLIADAERVEDLIAIQTALSEIEYEIDRLTGELRGWDQQVEYAQVSINLSEVKTYPLQPSREGLGERLGDGFMRGLSDFVAGLQGVLVWLVWALPFLIPGTILVVLAVIVARRVLRKRRSVKDDAPPQF